jgi:hypothetical protein
VWVRSAGRVEELYYMVAMLHPVRTLGTCVATCWGRALVHGWLWAGGRRAGVCGAWSGRVGDGAGRWRSETSCGGRRCTPCRTVWLRPYGLHVYLWTSLT